MFQQYRRQSTKPRITPEPGRRVDLQKDRDCGDDCDSRRFVSYPGGRLDLDAGPLLMGVLNVTPDSFSDGGLYFDAGRAVERGLQLAAEGADIIDVGGESSRPGARRVEPAEQVRRTRPVIEALCRQLKLPISIDTTSAAVAAAAVEAGAVIVNDISACRADPQMITLLRQGIAVVLMHMKGTPATMQALARYGDVVGEVRRFLRRRCDALLEAGVAPEQIMIDPGIGFAKTVEHNLLLLRHIDKLLELGRPVVLGVSRKSFIGQVLGIAEPSERLWGTAAAVALAVAAGVQVLRVHDVAQMRQVAEMAAAIVRSNEDPPETDCEE